MPEVAESPAVTPETKPIPEGEDYTPLASLLVNTAPKPDGTPRTAPVKEEPSGELPRPIVAKPEPKPAEADKLKREDYKKLEERAKKAESDFAALQSSKGEHEKRIADLEAALAASKSAAGNVDGLKLTLTERDNEIRRLQEELRTADIRRDPEFEAKFEHGLKFHVERMTEIGGTVVEKTEIERLIRLGDDDKLAEVREALSPGQKVKWDAARLKIEELSTEKEQLLKRSDETWKTLQEQRRQKQLQNARSQGEQTLTIGNGIVQKIFSSIPPIQEDSELRDECKALVRGVSGFEGAEQWTTEKMMESLVMRTVLNKIAMAQNAAIEGLTKEKEEAAEKIKSLEEVLKSRGISVNGDSENYKGPPVNEDPYAGDEPLASKLVVRR